MGFVNVMSPLEGFVEPIRNSPPDVRTENRGVQTKQKKPDGPGARIYVMPVVCGSVQVCMSPCVSSSNERTHIVSVVCGTRAIARKGGGATLS